MYFALVRSKLGTVTRAYSESWEVVDSGYWSKIIYRNLYVYSLS